MVPSILMPTLTPDLAPHLYLGVPSQADKAACGAGFARATRRIKSSQTSAISVQDLTSALSSAEHQAKSEFSLRFTIPANPRVTNGPESISVAGREFDASSDISSITTEGLDSRERERISAFLLRCALKRLWGWEWSEAGLAAQQCLKFSREEDTRDEALNVLAASLVMRGESAKAVDALKQAVAGRWNLNLQGNLVLLASSDSPELAVEHLAHFVLGAEDPSERLGACRMAVDLWSKVTEQLGEGNAPPMPRPVINSFYELLRKPGITEEEFFDLGLFLAETDDDSKALLKTIDLSAQGNTVSAQMLRKNIEDFGSYAVALVSAENLGQLAPRPWLQTKLDAMIQTMNQMFTSDEVENKPIDFAFGLINNGLKCKSLERVSLLAFMVWHLRDVFTDENDVPKGEFVVWVLDAYSLTRARGAFEGQNPEYLELVQGFIQSALNALMFLFYRGYWNLAIQVQQNVNALLQESRKWFPNRSGMQSSAREIQTWCAGVLGDCKPLRLRCTDNQLNSHVDQLLEHVTQFKNAVSSFA